MAPWESRANMWLPPAAREVMFLSWGIRVGVVCVSGLVALLTVLEKPMLPSEPWGYEWKGES
jgi:hypothetical protein